jgi:hypothetical protein
MADEKKDDLVDVENMEINALDDKEMESVSGGGWTDTNTAASCACCVALANRPGA